MNSYLYTQTYYNHDDSELLVEWIVISPDPKREGLYKSTLYQDKERSYGFSDAYGKCNQAYIQDLIKKSTILN